MPTTSRLVAAVLMAILAWIVAQIALTYVLENKPVGLFAPISALFGLLVGWFWVGRQIEKGTGSGVSLGFVGAVLVLFWVVLTFSGYEMLLRATRLRYDGPIEALEDMIAIAFDYLIAQAHIEVMGVLGAGGIVVGAIVQWVSRRYR